eukprot:8848687-Lingulodinium_polyedra.AAC.1
MVAFPAEDSGYVGGPGDVWGRGPRVDYGPRGHIMLRDAAQELNYPIDCAVCSELRVIEGR